MKRVLITGANSYVGTNVEKWLMKEPDRYYVETLDMKDPNWKNFDFSKFDVVFHVAGIAHIKETKENKQLYFKINKELAVDTAIKAKQSGVKQFIFMSTMSVYGKNKGIISNSTLIKPFNAYGESKYLAEIEINNLSSSNFRVSILRPPMIYGFKSPGNYVQLSNFVKKNKIFPKFYNQRSFIFILHLAEFIKLIVDYKASGIFHPQNNYLSSTNEIVMEISKNTGTKIHICTLLHPITLFSFIPKISKVTTSLYYDRSLYDVFELNIIKDSSIYSFSETIKMAEGK